MSFTTIKQVKVLRPYITFEGHTRYFKVLEDREVTELVVLPVVIDF